MRKDFDGLITTVFLLRRGVGWLDIMVLVFCGVLFRLVVVRLRLVLTCEIGVVLSVALLCFRLGLLVLRGLIIVLGVLGSVLAVLNGGV